MTTDDDKREEQEAEQKQKQKDAERIPDAELTDDQMEKASGGGSYRSAYEDNPPK